MGIIFSKIGEQLQPGKANGILSSLLSTRVKLSLIGIILFGATLRIWGINFGLPYLYNPDEPIKVTIALRILETGDLNPRYFKKPSLMIYLDTLTYIPYYLGGKILGVFKSVEDLSPPLMLGIAVGKSATPSTVLLGRLLTALFGTASIVLIFFIGRLSSGDKVGLLGALMLAISPTNVAYSRLVETNTFLVFFILATWWASIRIYQQGKTRDYILAGIAAGLAISSKYNGGVIIILIIAAHFLREGWRGFSNYKVYLALFLTPVAFLATTPFALLDYKRFMSDVFYEVEHYSNGHAGMEGNALTWYLLYLWQIEGPVVVLAFWGALHGFYAHFKQTLLAFLFPVLYLIIVSNFEIRNDRTILPLTPFLFLLAASGLVQSFNRWNIFNLSQTKKALNFLWLVVILLCLIIPLFNTMKDGKVLTTVDSRETARVWIANNMNLVPPHTKVAIEGYAPFIDPEYFTVESFTRLIDNSPDWYIANHVGLLIFSEGMFGRFYQEPDKYSAEIAQYEALFNRFKPIKIFTDGNYEVRIYQTQ